MDSTKEKIFIIDEARFAHICASILASAGFRAESYIREDAPESEERMSEVALIITSYPYGKSMMEKLKGLTLPVIVLTDHVGREIVGMLEELEHTYCLVKPIDYGKFTSLVKVLMSGVMPHNGGYHIV